MIRINDLTRRSFKVVALDDNETVGDLGGYPKHIEDVPESLWNPRGNLDFRVERISDPLYAGGAVMIRNALKWKGNAMTNIYHKSGDLTDNRLDNLTSVLTEQVIMNRALNREFNALIKSHGYENEESADVAAIVANELKLFQKERLQ